MLRKEKILNIILAITIVIFAILCITYMNFYNRPVLKEKIRLEAYEKEMVSEVNEFRRENGVEELAVDNDAKILADYKINDMIEHNYFSHKNLDGKYICDLAPSMNVHAEVIGENLHYAKFDKNIGKYSKEEIVERLSKTYTTKDIMEAFMNSPGHKANILKQKYNRIYISVIFYKDTIYVIQIFLKK
ncbi:Cysteine-rich secretory protein family protein [Clostridium cavendishii DSM 21758]|uniref:Cysteine-rich secretory protein family protein n=1 Tax=Clostridium cavendishii DSM 21758 TaxID=1121302 RepID=A0A1M6VCN2_9CLOT|nr:CAP domain-containing protein [Clostridium cavendishii]SHK79230.1 Cysteine-rich secretory protein family protein [Clostridium cavendishii DSM 21758]